MSSLLLLLFTSFLLLDPIWTLEFHYHGNSEIEQYLIQTSRSNPNITHLYSIGTSVRGQQLWVLALGVNPQRHIVGIPEFKYVANMHGNEVLGRELLLHLIDLDPLMSDVLLKKHPPGSMQMGGASLTPDDDVFVHLSREYSFSHASMHRGNICQSSRAFPDGITNGYQWYPLAGGMQDYNYVWAQCLEVTLELSCCKFPPAAQLEALWTDNAEALLAYVRQVHLGVKGVVYDGSGVAVRNALVEVEGRKNVCPFRTNSHGEYYRLLLPGNYTFTVTYPGHEVLTETLSIPYGPDKYSAMTHHFRLRRTSATTTVYMHTCPTPGYSHAVNLEGGGATSRPPWFRHAVGVGLAVLGGWVIE